MIRLTSDRAQVETTIKQMIDKTLNMDLLWDWPCGVAYYGVATAYEVLGDASIIERLQARIDRYIELGLPKWNVNACAMGHCLITLYEVTEDPKYWDLVMSKIDYLQNHALRFGQNILQHTVSAKNDFPEQAWADTLFMAAYFMLRVGVKLKDEVLIRDALQQYFWHIEFLQDKETSLWYHGYSHIKGDHMSGFYWARANAWAAYTMSRVGKILPEPYLYPEYMDIDCSLRDQLSALKNYQTENGLWRTLLDDEESYEELSASAGIAAAIVTNGNPLLTDYAQKAYEGILEEITPDGRLLNVSGGTAIMRDRGGYRNISRKWMQGWGQGLGLVFLTAVLKSPDAGREA